MFSLNLSHQLKARNLQFSSPMTSAKNVFVPTANGIIEKSSVDHGEASGPRVGLRLTADQAAFILTKHDLIPPICSPLTFTYIDRGFNNRTYVALAEDPKTEFVIRLTGNCWTRMKTENEVAAIMHLSAQTSLAPTLPTIFAFSSSKERSGVGSEYIVMSKLRGVPLDEIFLGLSSLQKKKVLRGVADLLADMKNLAFSSIGSLQFEAGDDTSSCGEGFKSVTDDRGGGSVYSRIVVGPGLEAGCGPFQTYLEYLRATCTTELKHLEECPFLMEEQHDESASVRELIGRIERFVDVMCDPGRTKFGEDVTNVRMVFTHGDFEPRNILVDEDTLEITGLVDFEFSGAFPEDDDWMAGFQWIGATTSEEEAFGDDVNTAEILCRPNELSELRAYFLQRCESLGVRTPQNIPGHATRALMYHFRGNIAPWWMREDITPTPPEWPPARAKARQRIAKVLDQFGF